MKEVLVVDDNHGVLLAVAEILRRVPCSVTTHSDPLEALGLCHLKHFDVVVTDLNMPGMSGIQLARRLRAELTIENGPERIVLLTSEYMEDLDDEIKGLFAEILHKPFHLDELRRCVLA